jgi:hypothetical protein
LIVTGGGSVPRHINNTFNDFSWHRFIFELSGASPADDYVAVYIRIEIFSIHPGDLFFFQMIMAYGIAGTYGNTVAAAIAQINIRWC